MSSSFAQTKKLQYYLSDSLQIVNSSNQALQYAFSGGYHCPQFSPCDVNGDGKKDVVIYDKLDGSISTYINVGGVGEAPQEKGKRVPRAQCPPRQRIHEQERR